MRRRLATYQSPDRPHESRGAPGQHADAAGETPGGDRRAGPCRRASSPPLRSDQRPGATREAVPDPPAPSAGEPNANPTPTMSLYEIRAPFDGTILDREMIVPGVAVDTTHRIFTLANLETVWVEANVHESDFDPARREPGGRRPDPIPGVPRSDLPRQGPLHGRPGGREEPDDQAFGAGREPRPPAQARHVRGRGGARQDGTSGRDHPRDGAADCGGHVVRLRPHRPRGVREARRRVSGRGRRTSPPSLSGLRPGTTRSSTEEGGFKLKAEHARARRRRDMRRGRTRIREARRRGPDPRGVRRLFVSPRA